MLKKTLSVLLTLLMIFGSITCAFTFTVSAENQNMIIIPTEKPTSLRNTTADSRLTGWSRTSGGDAAVTTEDSVTVVSRTEQTGGQLFTNTFTVEKNSTYRFSFEVKGGSDTSFTYTNTSGETLPRGINFVLNDFNVVKSDGTAYNSYNEGKTDYAHSYKAENLRTGFKVTWSIELADGSTCSFASTKYSSWGRKIGTTEAESATLKTVDLSVLYSDWRTVTCEFTVPDEDEYTSSDIAIGFILPGNADELYVRNVEMSKVVPPIADNTIPVTVVDAEGNTHPSSADIPVTTTAVDNGNGTYNIGITYDSMDGVNSFDGWYNGVTLLSTEENYTTTAGVDLEDITAKIVCRSVITGGLGFESYTSSTSLRVNPKQSGTPPYDDKWGIWSNFYKDASVSTKVGYENIDWDFDIKTAYGDTTVDYAPEYDTENSAFVTSTTTIKPYSGNSMFYFAARSRSIVRKLDNLKPDTDYELSFYTYNLTNWDFLSSAVVADTYDMKTGNTSGTDTVKVYGFYKEGAETSTVVSNRVEILDTSKVLNWQKISVKFSTDEDDTELYLHLECKTGNSSSSTSKQFIDNLTVTEILPPETFAEASEYVGTSIRRAADGVPQAIRFKFEILNSVSKVYKDEGYELSEYGALVAYNDNLKGSALEITEDMTVNGYEVVKGVAYSKADGINNVYETKEESVIVSFALYDIGVYGGLTDYSAYNRALAVRPYAIYVDAEGNEYICYDDTEDAALFDVTDTVLSSATATTIGATYGKTSSDYASYLSDVLAVRNLLSVEAVNRVYANSGRTGLVKNESATCTVTTNDLGENLSIHTELQANYLADNYNNIASYAGGTAELSRPLTFDFNWTIAAEGNGDFYGYLLTLSENSDLSNGKTYALQSNSTSIGNFKIGTDYYWNVAAIYSDGIYLSATDKFSTAADAPRNLYISGVTNVRDIGGWTINGEQTNQGLVFRTGSLGNTTEKGKITLFEDLGVKTEIDIRLESEAKNTFGDKINYYAFYMGYSGGSILTINSESIVKFFEVLGDESNYPIVFHCSIGTDRTGMMAFLLNGLLGASEEQLYRDYLYSNFGNIGSSRDSWAIGSYLGYVNKCEGDTLSERIYNYLLGIGVEAEDMDTYINMMTK